MYILPLLIMPCLSSAQLQQDLGFDLGRFYFQQPLAITADGSLSPHVIKKKKERKTEVPGFQTIIVFCCFLVPACYQQKPPHQWDQEVETRLKSSPCICRTCVLTSCPVSHCPTPICLG